jgi:LemA protein
MSDGILLTFAVLGLLTLITLSAVEIYNNLVRLQVRTREAWSGIDVQLRLRTSLVPNLVEVVQGYGSHERTVFDEVTRARNGLQAANGVVESTEANRELTSALGRLFAVAEDYPELKAASNFQDLQDKLSDIEEKIAYARQFYNLNVTEFNIQIRAIPDILVACILGMQRFEFFEAEDDTRDDVQVGFPQSDRTVAAGTPAREGR